MVTNKFIKLKGELFEQVHLGGVFPDSKTFVGIYPAFEPEVVLKKFNDEKSSSSLDLKKFVKENFVLTQTAACKLKLDENRTMEKHISALVGYFAKEARQKSFSI